MTTTLKLSVGGQYKATVRHMVDDMPYGEPLEVGPNSEGHVHFLHGKTNTLVITEEYVGGNKPVTTTSDDEPTEESA